MSFRYRIEFDFISPSGKLNTRTHRSNDLKRAMDSVHTHATLVEKRVFDNIEGKIIQQYSGGATAPMTIEEEIRASDFYRIAPIGSVKYSKKVVVNKGPRSKWSDADYLALDKLVGSNLTDRQIAEVLAKQFNRPVTENAINGAKYRLRAMKKAWAKGGAE